MKEKLSSVEVQKWIVLGIIVVFVLLGSLADIIFPNTAFATVIDSSIGKFFDIIGLVQNNYINIIESIAVIVFMGIIYYVLSVLIRLVIKNNNKGDTIVILLNSIVRFGCMVIAFVLVLAAWNVPSPTILAGAGIAGLAVSFGAQGLLEDVFAGLSIIFEKQFIVGDVVEVQGFRGEVIEIGPRNTKVKDIYGNILIMANSDIREIINLSQELSYAISEVGIEYSADIEKVEEILNANFPAIKEKIPTIINGPFYDGVEELGDSAVVVRVIAHCKEKHRFAVRRKLNKELKIIMDRHNINIPFPQLVLHKADADDQPSE